MSSVRLYALDKSVTPWEYVPVESINGAVPVTVTDTVLTAGERISADVIAVEQQFEYTVVAASQTQLVTGSKLKADSTAVGDFLHSVIITANTGAITIYDNDVAVIVFPASQPIGVYPLNLLSVSGAWNITTAASTGCTAVGRFS